MRTASSAPLSPLQAAGWGVAEKQSFKASASLVTPWTPLLRGNVSLENSKLSHALHVTSTCGKQNLSLSAALTSVDKVSCDAPVSGRETLVFKVSISSAASIFVQVLLRRQVTLKVTHQRPKSPTTELELEGVMEVLRRDNKMYQKSAVIQLRSVLKNHASSLCDDDEPRSR